MKDEPEESSIEKETEADKENLGEGETPEIEPTIDDPAVDDAIDNIVKHESDEVLEVETAKHVEPPKRAWYKRFLANKKFLVPTVILVLIIILAGIPWTRYKVAGLVWKQTFTIAVTDTQTKQPVSEATVNLAGKTFKSDNKGKIIAKVRVGSDTLSVSKQYYKSVSTTALVPIMKQKQPFTVYLQATGRQVPLTVVNKINGAAAGNVLVSAAGSQARTDKNGKVTIVLPADKTTAAATLSGDGFNNLAATIHITAASDPANKFQITPAGKVYFLSNLSGKIDVVKTNLDGTARQTVLAGTGNEDPNNTVLLASTDWKYLALLAVRTAGGNPELDLIDATNNDQLTNIDQGNATFSPIGWDGDSFIYQVSRNNIQDWQPNQESLKSFNAVSRKLTTLDSTTASGTGQTDFLKEQFGSTFILNDGEIVYAKNWTGGYNVWDQLSGKQASLNSVQPDGSGSKVIKSFGVSAGTQTSYVSVNLENYEPDGLYVYSNVDTATQVYKYEDGQIVPTSDVNANTFYTTAYNYYLLSPSAKQAFWSEARDGKNTLFVGDQNGDNGKQIATLSDYDVYGWYSDNYLLVFKNSSELFVMPVAGGTPLKITDYYKPVARFDAYGGR